MPKNLDPLDGLIADTRARLDKLERQAEAVRVELAAYERARSIVSGELPTRLQARPVATITVGRQRALKREWMQMLSFIAEQPQRIASIDEMDEYATYKGLGIKRNTLRSQLSIYSGVDSGLLERVGPGRYGITDRGLSVLGVLEHVRPEAHAQEGNDQADDEYGRRPARDRTERSHEQPLGKQTDTDDLDADIPF